MQEKKKLAIEVDNVQKIYKLYDKPSDRMKEAFGFGKKTKHKLHYALKGVDMKIYQGETVGIIGTNGSGKSTILKIITGVLNPAPSSSRAEIRPFTSTLPEVGFNTPVMIIRIEELPEPLVTIIPTDSPT